MITLNELLSFLNATIPVWVTATAYAKGENVTETGIVYVCLVDHTSGTFATDLAANKWRIESIYQQSVDSAIKFVEKCINRSTTTGNVTTTFNGQGGDVYYLNSPLSSVTSVKKYDEATNTFLTIFDGSDTVSNSLYFNGSEGWVKLVNGYTFTLNELYEIVYVGIGETNAYIKQQCLEAAALMYYQTPHNNQDRLGRTSKNTGGQSQAGESYNTIETFDSIETNLLAYRTWNV